jgi:hypothetical protein
MTRHIADKPRTALPGARLRAFAAIERALGGARPQTLALQRRARALAAEGRRTAEFLRIARGRTV